jgi:hypothetical protein
MTNTRSNVVTFLKRCRSQSVSQVAESLGLQRRDANRLIEHAFQTLRSRSASNEELRIGAVKVLVAALPQSFPLIQQLLLDFSTSLAYEVHFTLFCFLDDALYRTPSYSVDRRTIRRLLRLVELYLNRVPSTRGSAAWMAGDLLGDHWRSGGAVDVLLRTAKNSRQEAGRLGAIHGLAHALTWVGRSTQREIRALLGTLACANGNESISCASVDALEHHCLAPKRT